jgi:hypothetical protein
VLGPLPRYAGWEKSIRLCRLACSIYGRILAWGEKLVLLLVVAEVPLGGKQLNVLS